ncbi:MAG: ABC transporter ATP-binding protein [Defluviitaleaceae bacterium]|nr:ABC transporter ATP-binding protein [Defluviitaleaceae bacterium]MCL2240016.1 ABC transporter ATP-binding protein [Defluviitaleaceae bacterium]MCL2240691.1 ABC transporter ATP-binding protein [Defluviitaleaceae bacterium]
MITMRNVSKSYGDKPVLTDVNFQVGRGEIFGLLGPSGAGKTTIINILTKQLEPDSGEITVDATPREVGLMLDSGGLYPHLNCMENLDLYARIYDLPKSKPLEVLKNVGLGEDTKKAASALSRGMSQRLSLARAILYSPKLLFLDEPTSALDPGTARGICKLLRRLCDEGATIFLTTHNMDEALKLCDRVALLHEGKIVEQGAPVALCGQYNALRTVPDLEAVFLQLTGVEL